MSRPLPNNIPLAGRVLPRLQAFSLTGKSVVLALSGGKDSVCLFHLLRTLLPGLGASFCAAHVHHHLRGETADRDEAFCRDLCAEWGVEYHALHRDVPALLGENKGLSVEDAARRARYEALLTLCREKGALLATAHTASDQTETVFLKLLRGGGLDALSGIHPSREDGVIRPLLDVTAGETRAFCVSSGYAFVEDESNGDDAFLRNRLRNTVLPLLREINPALDETLAREGELARTQSACLKRLTEEKLASLGLSPIPARVERARLAPLLEDGAYEPVLHRLFCGMLFTAGAKEQLSWERTQALVALLSASPGPGRFLEAGGGFGFLLEAAHLTACRTPEKGDGEPVVLAEGENRIPALDAVFSVKREKEEKKEEFVHKFHTTAVLDCDKIKGQLFVRTRLPGDTYTVRNREREVRDLFSARAYPLPLRDTFPLVCDEAGIVWIPGELAADRVRASSGIALSLLSGAVHRELTQRRQYE